MPEETIVPSLCELMNEAFHLSLKLCYATLAPDDHYLDPREDLPAELEDLVAGWADGLFHKYYDKMASGHCSIKAMIEFDIEKFEAEVVAGIATMKKAIAELPPLRKLTYLEMRERGYRGSWAGMNDAGEIVNL